MLFFDEELETNLIQNLIHRYDETQWTIDKLNSNDFYFDSTKKMFGVIKKAHSENRAADFFEIDEAFKSEDKELRDSAVFIASDIPIQKTTKLNFRKFKELGVKRIVSQRMTEAQALLGNDVDLAIKKLSTLSDIASASTADDAKLRHISEFAGSTLDLFDRRLEENSLLGSPSGYKKFDTYMDGLSDFIIVGGRPSMGKTAFALNLADGFINSTGKDVAFYSLETRASNIAERYFTISGEINQRGSAAYIKKQMKENPLLAESVATKTINKLKTSIQETSKKGFYVTDDYDMTIESIRISIRTALRNGMNLGMVIIDYAQICDTEEKFKNQNEQVGYISRTCKKMIVEFGIPILLLAQISRNVNNRATKEPTLADLKDSGSLEQDADKVILLHRPGYYLVDKSEDDNSVKVIIAKNKDGATGNIDFTWYPKILKFEEVKNDRE